MMPGVTSVYVFAGVSVSPHHANAIVRTSRITAAIGSVQLIPCQTNKKKGKQKRFCPRSANASLHPWLHEWMVDLRLQHCVDEPASSYYFLMAIGKQL